MAGIISPFLGNFSVSLDAKNRVAMPKSMRETLQRSYGDEADRVIATMSIGEPAIAVYPVSQFNALMEKLNEPTELDDDPQSLLMLFTGSARECPIDGQGRIRLPEDLLAYAELDKDALFCGHFRRMQIWNPERWSAFRDQAQASMAERSKRAARSVKGLV